MNDKSNPSVKVDLSASAKASIEIKAEIPKTSTGRLVDALTDIIRPYTEKRGLDADNIRLQREEVLIDIAKKTQERLLLEKKKATVPPAKFTVRFLESASLETKENSRLIGMWASLLASATTNYQEDHVTYIDILSNITSKEAQIIKNIIPHAKYTSMSVFVGNTFLDGFSQLIHQLITTTPDLDAKLMRKILVLQLEGREVSMSSIGAIPEYEFKGDPWRDSDPDIYSEIESKLESLANKNFCKFLSIYQRRNKGQTLILGREFINYASLANLEKHCLLGRRSYNHEHEGVTTTVEWMTVTPLCLNLMAACGER